jgi:ubiquitin-protein ligase
VKLVLQRDFPASPPKGRFEYGAKSKLGEIYVLNNTAIFLGFFMTKIFHPNVASNGEICVNTLKKDWKSDLGIKHILLVKINLILTNLT